MSTKLPEQILELLREAAKDDATYINPFFLQEITGALEAYYQLEDDDVDRWAYDMFGM